MKNINELNDVRLIVSPDRYDMKSDSRLLIPFAALEHNTSAFIDHYIKPIKLGFATKDGEIVIPAQYDRIYDDFYSKDDFVRVGKIFTMNKGTEEKPRLSNYMHVGIIDATGKELVPCEKYRCIELTNHRDRFLAYTERRRCALIDSKGNEILPLGKIQKVYSYAFDFARAMDVDNGWCIFDMQGNIIIPGGLFRIWNIYEDYDTIVVERKGVRYKIPFAVLRKCQEELRETGKITTNVEDFLDYETYMQKKFPTKQSPSFILNDDGTFTHIKYNKEDDDNDSYYRDNSRYKDPDYISPLEAFEGDENLYDEWLMNT